MKFLVKFLLVATLSLGGLISCVENKNDAMASSAMIDVNTIIGNGPHAQAAAKQLQDAQEIYQYNLNIIKNKLSEYKNKEQAHAYLMEAARQLQVQMNNSKLLVTQALLNALNTVVAGQKKDYDLIIKKDGIIYVNEGNDFKAMPEDITTKSQALYNNTTVTFPALPKIVENPELPADLGEGVPFPPAQQQENSSGTEK